MKKVIRIRQQDVDRGMPYIATHDRCPFARAVKREFPNRNIRVEWGGIIKIEGYTFFPKELKRMPDMTGSINNPLRKHRRYLSKVGRKFTIEL